MDRLGSNFQETPKARGRGCIDLRYGFSGMPFNVFEEVRP